MTDFWSVAVPALSSLGGVVVGGWVTTKAVKETNEAAATIAAEERAARYQDQRRERLREAYSAMLLLAAAYASTLTSQGFVMEGETVESRDAALYEHLDKANATYRAKQMDLALDSLGRVRDAKMTELRWAYITVQQDRRFNREAPGPVATERITNGIEDVQARVIELDEACRQDLESLALTA